MSSRRLSTVHDLSALRLHPDGTRVQQVIEPFVASTTSGPATTNSSLRPRRATYVTQDPRGNWIARDAGGLGQVKKRRRRSSTVNEEGEEVTMEKYDLTGVGSSATAEDRHAKEVDADEEEEEVFKDERAKKRRRFERDLGFLDLNLPNPGSSFSQLAGDSTLEYEAPLPADAADTHDRSMRLPSSDLLKCIHYFASEYYTSKGQLLNSSKQYRKEKKERRLRKLQEMTRDSAAGEDVSSDIDSHEDSVGGSHHEGEAVSVKREVGASDAQVKGKKRSKRTSGKRSALVRDMYKAFDGSALMAFGMLLQEHIHTLIEPRIADRWEDMEAFQSES